MKIIYTNNFKKTLKKLHRNQKLDLDEAVLEISANPKIGDLKLGKLAGIRVHKFKMVGNLCLLAYSFHEQQIVLELLKIGPHENFYRDLESELQ